MALAKKTAAITTVATEDLEIVARLGKYTLGVLAMSTIDYTVQFTLGGGVYFDIADLADKTATASAVVLGPVEGFRLKVNSVTGGAARLYVVAL